MEKTIAGKQITINEEGYLTDFGQWDECIGEVIAAEAGVALTPRHWEILKYLQKEHSNRRVFHVSKQHGIRQHCCRLQSTLCEYK